MGEKRSLSQSQKKAANKAKSSAKPAKPAKPAKRQQTPEIGNQTRISSFLKHPSHRDTQRDNTSGITIPELGSTNKGNKTICDEIPECSSSSEENITNGIEIPERDPSSKEENQVSQEKSDSDTMDEETAVTKSSSKYNCTSQCCSGDTPFQPTDIHTLKETSKQWTVKTKTVTRHVQKVWFETFPWLTLCLEKKKVFCFTCRRAYRENLLVFVKGTVDKAFLEDGFGNWKKAVSKFKEHESSGCHKEATQKLAIKDKNTIPSLMHSKELKDQHVRRQSLLKQLSSIRFLLEQGLPLRGHREDDGNFLQLLQLRSEDSPELRSWILENKYLSPEVVNKQIALLAQTTLRAILDKIKDAKWFTVMADESTDITNKEQLTVCVRWVDDYCVHEDFIGLLQVENITSTVISAALKEVLIRCGLFLQMCRGQAYDGAANMMGHISGVATVIQNEYPAALSVHCFAHCINLCLQDTTKKCKAIRDALDLIFEVEKLISYSPKREVLFLKQKLETSPLAPNLRPLCPTRWPVRTAAIGLLLQNYETLLDVLHSINTTSSDEYSRRAGGQASMMEKFSTFFGLKLSHLLFSAGEQLSISIQGVMTSMQDVQRAALQTKTFYQSQQNENSFDIFYQSVEGESSELMEKPCLPRYKHVPKRIDEGRSESHRFEAPKEYFRQQYFECLDLVIGELERRFHQKNSNTVRDIECLLLNGANGAEPCNIPESVTKLYSEDIAIDKLSVQLRLLPSLFVGKVKKVTSIDTICQYLSEGTTTKLLLSEIDVLLRIYLTIPVTTATPERSFSSLRRIKTYLRGTMSQERLNHCMVCYVHKNVVREQNLIAIAKLFVNSNSRRKHHFGQFWAA